MNTQGTNAKLGVQLVSSFAAFALLAACGGGGGSGGPISTPGPAPSPSPSPVPSPSPSPTPSPTPTPASFFNTQEYRDSDGPVYHNAITAWQSGRTGQGQTIAVIDTGIDKDSPEFAGRIHVDSRDVAGTRDFEAEDDHGTHVALVAAAARNNTGVMGIAYQANILALRADAPGSCNPTAQSAENSCNFFDTDIARGVDQAITSGAKVINISLGGGAPDQVLRSAISRAAAANIVVVVSAGNDGEGNNAQIPPDQPDPFASGLVDAGNGNVIIAGSVNKDGQFSAFSNRAGNYAGSFLSALGEEVCCIYENGQLVVRSAPNGQFVLVFSGTSFSAPQISGAVALLAQAFPNLTARQIVTILLDSARDAGATGDDPIYGSGILDIARAFAPQGLTTLAGSVTAMPLGEDIAVGSPAMGDALGQGALSVVVQDKYRRAYTYDMSTRLSGSAGRPELYPALAQGTRHVSGSSNGLALAFTLDNRGGNAGPQWSRQLSLTTEDAEQARVLAARVALKLSPETQLGFALSEGGHGLVAQLQGQERPAFLIADSASGDTGFMRGADYSLALRRQMGSWGVSLSAEQGDAWLGSPRRADDKIGAGPDQFAVRSYSLALDRQFGPWAATLGLTWLDEQRTMLGGYFHEAFGARGADTLFIDAESSLALGKDWRAGAGLRYGYTRARSGEVIAAGSQFTSSGWSADLVRSGVFQPSDALGLRISQPLRVRGGSLLLDLPVSYDYATETATLGRQSLLLAPDGREIMGELSWHGALWEGSAAASLFYRSQPGHYAAAPADAGVAIKWSRGF